MKLNTNKILFLASCDGPGVEKKMEGLCGAAVKAGYGTEVVFQKDKGFRLMQKQQVAMLKTDAKYIIMRSPSRNSIYYVCTFLILRFQGKVLIVDQPSPAATYITEVNFQARSFLNKAAKKLLTYIGCPFTFMFANRIVQYGEESSFFRFFSKNNTLLTGNGIDTKRLPLRQKLYPDGKEHLSLIGVAGNISEWHGFDRIVKAMGEWKKLDRKLHITFNIVGGYDTLHAKKIRELIKHYDIEDDVTFLGYQSSDVLNSLYNKASLAVASLGLHRNGLSMASVLKAREYCLAGIPFIAAGIDPDFKGDIPFRFVVSNDDNIDDILKIFDCFAEKRALFSDEDIRQYAIDYLSFDGKFKEIMKGL